MLKIQVRANSTASLIKVQLATRLEEYFQNTAFQFSKPHHVEELRRVMELVYLRKRPLVAVDVEAYERKPKLVTEIGFSIYDPENQWLSIQPHIRSVHIISHENRRLYNSMYVPNNKLKFNGSTSFQMYQKVSSSYLTDTFKYYFEKRGAVLVGHNLSGDIKWLKSLGVASDSDTPQVDTQKLFHMSRPRGATLRGILQAIDIPHANLHNAANDAYYTLLAAMGYCDPERRSHFDMDTFVDEPIVKTQVTKTKKATKAALRKDKFSEKATVLTSNPPLVDFNYPLVELGQGEIWVSDSDAE